MDESRFDDLAKRLATRRSRRGVLKALGTATLAALGLGMSEGTALAKDKGDCRSAGHPCEGNQSCCTGLECRVTGPGSAARCMEPSCTPTTCLAQGVTCGPILDGCGGTLDCGSCSAPQTCGGGGAPGVCGCTDESQSITCANRCGTVFNNCGRAVDCGPCCVAAGQACTNDSACCSGMCDQGICLARPGETGAACDSQVDCAIGVCCDGYCAEPASFATDPLNCGACSVVCDSGACLGGQCVICAPGSTTDCYSGPAGTVGVGICAAGTQTCLPDGSGYGACQGEVRPRPELCNGLDEDCDGRIDNGASCSPRPHASGTCTEGVCVYACDPGYSDCDGDLADPSGNGCETSISSDLDHCGACGNACAAGANESVTCVDGTCASTCNDGYIQCGAACETCDQILGSRWRESENGTTGVWVRQQGNRWIGDWDNGAHAELTITCSGRTVTIHRVDPPGTRSAGLIADYTGTIGADCVSISGEEKIFSRSNAWSATILG